LVLKSKTRLGKSFPETQTFPAKSFLCPRLGFVKSLRFAQVIDKTGSSPADAPENFRASWRFWISKHSKTAGSGERNSIKARKCQKSQMKKKTPSLYWMLN
jgi:hypothetical protein